jgi:replicative DNA helicase
MNTDQNYGRIASILTGIDGKLMKAGLIRTEVELSKVYHTLEAIGEWNFYLDDSERITVGEIAAKCRELKKREGGLDLVVIDYLQLINVRKRLASRELEVGEIGWNLKCLAKELNVPVLCLAQLSRKVEERKDKRPELSDLRESGRLEQDADDVIFLYREGYYKKNDDMRTEAIIAKQRNGALGMAELQFYARCTRFKEWD